MHQSNNNPLLWPPEAAQYPDDSVRAFLAANPDVVDVFYTTTPPAPLVDALKGNGIVMVTFASAANQMCLSALATFWMDW